MVAQQREDAKRLGFWAMSHMSYRDLKMSLRDSNVVGLSSIRDHSFALTHDFFTLA